jgi:hypothetical protein
MVMSVCFENLKFLGQFLCPSLGDLSPSVLKDLKELRKVGLRVWKKFKGVEEFRTRPVVQYLILVFKPT